MDSKAGAPPPRKRMKLPPEHTALLETHFDTVTQPPTSQQLQDLAEAVGLTVPQVKQWFKNHRRIKAARALAEHTALLQTHFDTVTQHPTSQQLQDLAEEVGVTVPQVQQWFSKAARASKTAAGPPPKKGTQFSPEQAAVLNEHFHKVTQFPTRQELEKLAVAVKDTRERVQVWFQNRRQRRGATEEGATEEEQTFSLEELVSLLTPEGATEEEEQFSLEELVSLLTPNDPDFSWNDVNIEDLYNYITNDEVLAILSDSWNDVNKEDL